MKRRWQTPHAYVKNILEEILQTDGSARVVAFSFALGSFIALLPTFGFGPFVGLTLLLLFPKLHKPALLFAFVVWNPIVQVPLYSLSIIIGSYLFSGMPVVSFDFSLLDHAYNLTRRVLVGNVIVSTSLTLISYAFIFILIRTLKGRPVFMTQK